MYEKLKHVSVIQTDMATHLIPKKMQNLNNFFESSEQAMQLTNLDRVRQNAKMVSIWINNSKLLDREHSLDQHLPTYLTQDRRSCNSKSRNVTNTQNTNRLIAYDSQIASNIHSSTNYMLQSTMSVFPTKPEPQQKRIKMKPPGAQASKGKSIAQSQMETYKDILSEEQSVGSTKMKHRLIIKDDFH